MKISGTIFSTIFCISCISSASTPWTGGMVVVKGKVSVSQAGIFKGVQVKGQIISQSPRITKGPLSIGVDDLYTPGDHILDAMVKDNSILIVRDCENAIVAISAGQGNFLEWNDPAATGIIPQVLSFICIEDKN